MKKEEYYFQSANKKTVIHGTIWEPEGEIRSIIYIAHGITEHIGRYEEFAKYFTKSGYVVAGHDHLGHGYSIDKENPYPMYFGSEGSWKFVEEDVKTGVELLKKRYADVPLCLMGFSLGSFAVRCVLGDCPEIADCAIWAGTGQMKPAEIVVANAVCRVEQRRFGDKKGTPLLQKLTMETYNNHFKPYRTSSDWLCANPEAVDEYRKDPLCGEGFTISSFRELLYGMKKCGQPAHFDKMKKDIPYLLLSGKDDPVGGFGKGVEDVYKIMKEKSFINVEMKLFDGMRHDIFHEKETKKVYECIEKWLEQ